MRVSGTGHNAPDRMMKLGYSLARLVRRWARCCCWDTPTAACV